MQCFAISGEKDGAAGKFGWWLMPLRSGGSRGHTWYEKSGEMQNKYESRWITRCDLVGHAR